VTSPAATLLSVLAVYLAAAITPGVAVLHVMHTASSQPRLFALCAAAGIATGSVALGIAGMFGASAVVGQGNVVDQVLRLLCTCYLVYLGYRMVSTRNQPIAGTAHAPTSLWRTYLRAVITVVTNPKGLLFFGVVLTALVPSTASVELKIATIATISTASLCWHSTLALVFSSPLCRKGYRRHKPAADLVAGVLFIALGLSVAVI
jgi:threonine efflux protein